jgi:uncharacterized membrane protein
VLSLRLLNLWFHLLAASAWVGLSTFVAILWLPQIRGKLAHGLWEDLVGALVGRYVRWAWGAIHLLLLTGIFNLLSVGIDTGFTFPAAFLKRLIAKLAVVLLMIGIQVGLSVSWLPRFTERGPEAGSGRAVRRALVATSVSGAVALWLGLVLRM